MKYRKFGKLDWEVSILGFGTMRLPYTNNNYDQINYPAATQMLRYAIDNGVNYVDTAWMYHDGNSERFLGCTLKNGYREKVKLATKLHFQAVKTPADFDKILHKQLKRLQTDHIDMYLLHGLSQAGWHKLRDWNVLDWAEKAMTDGYIGHLGFSFHDSFPVFKEIVNAYDNWTMCQIQYNFLDEDVQAGTEGLHYAAERGLAIVIMEPLRGGRLADPPPKIMEIWKHNQKNPVDMALRWLWNKPEISCVLSGMNSIEQVRQNIEIACTAGRQENLNPSELELINMVRDEYNKTKSVPCTKCRYCMPCPRGVDIPLNFELYNDNNRDLSESLYFFMPEKQRANLCIGCRECEEKCPQQIKISELMPKVHKALWNQGFSEWVEQWSME
jgi:predicted aldo/keto reductase-like oxidoreductase